MKSIEILTQEAIALLKALIETPSFSSEEDQTALLIENWFKQNNIPFERENNNIWAFNKHFDKPKPTLLLNSHHDTVKPNQGYTNDPFEAILKDGKLFGLGSNDAGGCLVSLLATFVHFYSNENLPYNIVMVASAEEERFLPWEWSCSSPHPRIQFWQNCVGRRCPAGVKNNFVTACVSMKYSTIS